MLEQFPPTDFLEIYDRHAEEPYWFLSAETRQFVESLRDSHGERAVLLFQQLVVALSVARHSMPEQGFVIPRAVVSDIDRERTRMLAEISSGASYGTSLGDYFLKDLAVARLHMVPSGPYVVDLGAGIPRKVLKSGGVRQFVDAFFTFFVRRRPLRAMMQLHLSEKALFDFTPTGRDRSFLQLAEVLRANPNLRGIFGASWYYDPEVARMSPHLGFLRDPQDYGAKFFRLHSDKQSRDLATKRSARRKRLFEEGRYTPTAYAMVWFREDVLRWAAYSPFANDRSLAARVVGQGAQATQLHSPRGSA